MSVLDRVGWAEVDQDVQVQQTNRETHSPVISGFRWWARRPHAVIGALLDAAATEFGAEEFLVADPFSGGGTVTFEAARRGLSVYAQDLYPWPTFALASILRPVASEEFAEASRDLLASLTSHAEPYRRDEGAERWETTHVLRVRVTCCPDCGGEIHLFPDPLASKASRGKHETDGFFGCAACGSVSRAPLTDERFECSECSREASTTKDSDLPREVFLRCPHCKGDVHHSAVSAMAPRWKPFLVQERLLCESRRPVTVLRAASPLHPVSDAEELCWVGPEIPHGVETNQLLAAGFERWSDLYTRRQLRILLDALEIVRTMNRPPEIRDRLAVAVLGCCEMPAYLCRWDRHHPKTFEAMANHRYARSTVVVETNLLSPVGRGTLPRRLKASEKALAWMQQQCSGPSSVGLRSGNSREMPAAGGVLVTTGSSVNQTLPDGSARLVLTDPPYHDDVQYGELARPFHVFLAHYLGTGAVTPQEAEEATPNAVRGDDTQRYEDVVANCLVESRRILVEDGRLILTFHNNDLSAWEALSNALARAGFDVMSLAVVEAENASDHGKRGRKTFLCDLVLECVPRRHREEQAGEPTVSGGLESEPRKNLLAVGFALSERCNQSGLNGNGGPQESFRELYLTHLGRLGAEKVLIS